ncbi:hypothetical protein [Synechocystis sp. PCC 7509]|uniref:hypothetical protein n=1 Tax=Synechocystis sp. PCC 7509 TaxID=927677 RepID=UPI0002AC2A78|nr:hypothetical protein [Synechocystis sp. PCC 7509]
MISKIEAQSESVKPLGAYLIEAGMITPEQLEVALKKQSYCKKRLGTILVDCGWVKQQTIEYLMEKIVLPHRTANRWAKESQKGDTNLTAVEQINNYPYITRSSTKKLIFSLSPEKTTRFLVFLVSGLVVCSLFFQFCIYYLPDFPLRDTLASISNVDVEQNIPTLYSWSALLFCAMLLAIVAKIKQVAGDRHVNYWKALAIIFVYLALDEAIAIHEKFIEPLRSSLNTSGFLYYAWVIPGAIFAFAVFLGFLKFINALPPKTKRLFLTAGAVFIGGAMGMELLSGAYTELYTNNNFITSILTSIEEFMEMMGIVIFIYALLSYISSDLKGLNLNIKILSSKTYPSS